VRRVRQVVNFIALCLFYDWMYGQKRPDEWLDGTLWVWQKPGKLPQSAEQEE
jgi:hypothetical protein